MAWVKGGKVKRKTNKWNEILLDVHENLKHAGNYFIYDITSFFPASNGLERTKYTNLVSHTIIGKNQVIIKIICKDGSLSPVRAKQLAGDFYNGNTWLYRLD